MQKLLMLMGRCRCARGVRQRDGGGEGRGRSGVLNQDGDLRWAWLAVSKGCRGKKEQA